VVEANNWEMYDDIDIEDDGSEEVGDE